MNTMINRRKFLKMGTTAAGAVLLSACAVPTSAPVATETSVSAPAVVSETGSKVKITYWGSFSGVNGETEKALADKFNSTQSDVVLDYQFQGSYEETAQKLTAALQSKTAPEVSLLSDV